MRCSPILIAVAVLFSWSRGWCDSGARQAGYLYLSPVPRASYVSEQNRYVLVRFADVAPAQVTNLANFITVVGAMSGAHSGAVRVATDARTVIFTLDAAFLTNELVTVQLNPQTDPSAIGSVEPFEYQFMTTAPMPGSLPAIRAMSAVDAGNTNVTAAKEGTEPQLEIREGQRSVFRKAMVLANGVSVPGDFPQVVITVNTNPSPGYLFLENALDGVPPYTMMLDNNGLPVWYRRGRMYDFKIQKNGTITWALSDDTGFPAFDLNFKYLRTYAATNGYLTDSHDLKVLADGSYYLIGYRNNVVDMSQYLYGGATNATVRETVVQGFTAADELIFQWRAWDNYDIRDEGNTTDFPHMNGIDIDDDGNLLVSARHLSEITKIAADSGEIIWRLSGAHNMFKFVNDPFRGTSFQHNISALGNGHYMVFDNGDTRNPPVSRAIEYQLNLTNMTATMAWQFRDKPDKYSFWLGSAQRLPTGNTLIDFSQAKYPKAIEVDTNGMKRFELSLVPSADSYRAFRFPWAGMVSAPYLVIEPQPDNLTLLFNKFGDTNVAFYRIYGGSSSLPTNIMAETPGTMQQLTDLPNGIYHFRVTAISAEGVESPFSNEESVYVNITPAGQNMLQNADFSQGNKSWQFSDDGNVSASWQVQEGASVFSISEGGNSLAGVQLAQGNLALIQGSHYVLEFDAWSDRSQYFQAAVTQSDSPFSDYSGLQPTFITPNRTHYRYVFSMQQASDFTARLVFELGSSAGLVYLANVSLLATAPGDLNFDGRSDLLDLDIFSGSWLKQQSDLPGDLDGNGKVDFDDFDMLGKSW